jgi:hypothetical protein
MWEMGLAGGVSAGARDLMLTLDEEVQPQACGLGSEELHRSV